MFLRLIYLIISLSFVCAAPLVSAQQLPASADSSLIAIRHIANDSERLQTMYRLARNMESPNPAAEVEIARVLLEETRRLKDVGNEARAHYALGMGYKAMADYAQSLRHFLAALQIRKDLQDYRAEAEIDLLISQIYDLTRDLDEQKRYILLAKQVCDIHHIDDEQATVLDELATVYKKAGRLDSAVILYNTAIAIERRQQDTASLRASLCNLAIALKSKKDYVQSLQHYNAALSLTDTVNDAYTHAVIMGNMSILFYEMGDLARGKAYALHVLSLAPMINDASVNSDVYEVLKNIAIREKDYPAAITYFNRWVAARDTLLNAAQSEQIKELQAKYDLKEKDKQIADQDNQLSYNRKLNLFLTVCSGLLLAIGIAVYSGRRKARRLNRKITEQKAELEKLNAVKDRVFSVISHDLRTPVKSLISFMQLLEQENLPQEKLQAYANALKDNLGYAAGLMENLLGWAYSQMQGYKPLPEYFDLSETILQTINLFKAEAARKNIQIENRIPQPTVVFADMNMTAIILRNLLSNAVKYTPAGGHIAMHAATSGDTIAFTIADSGTGLPDTILKIFNSEVQPVPVESRAGTNSEKGTGLGLMLCRIFAELMHGTIRAFNNPTGGAVFTLELAAQKLQ